LQLSRFEANNKSASGSSTGFGVAGETGDALVSIA